MSRRHTCEGAACAGECSVAGLLRLLVGVLRPGQLDHHLGAPIRRLQLDRAVAAGDRPQQLPVGRVRGLPGGPCKVSN